MSDDVHESRLLLSVLRERWDEVEATLDSASIDPLVLVSLARACDVHPTIHARLESRGILDRLGEEAAARLREWRQKCRADNLLLLARLEQALDLLLGAGVVPVALKGVDVLHRFSIGFDERTLDDVDLLVRREQVAEALAVLEGAGWRGPDEPERTHWLRSSFEMPLTSPGPVGVAFEIHWSLGQRRRYRLDTEAIFERTVPLDVAGRRILRLDDHDAVAHLLVHHVQHYFDRRLKWALDLGAMVGRPGFDWRPVATRLESWGGRAAAGMALLHLRRLFPDVITGDAPALLPASWWRRAMTSPLRSSHPLDLFRGTRNRKVQLYLAAILLERPWEVPAYLLHRATRDSRASEEPPVGKRG